MDLAPGTALGPFRIVALVGAGGMGEVYRAHDTKLDRDVAIAAILEREARWDVLPATTTPGARRLIERSLCGAATSAEPSGFCHYSHLQCRAQVTDTG